MAVHRARLARHRDSGDSCLVQVLAIHQDLHALACAQIRHSHDSPIPV